MSESTLAVHKQGEYPAFSMSEDALISVLSSSLYVGAKPESIKMVLGYCKAQNLDPMQKPVHIVPIWDSKLNAMRDVVMEGIGFHRSKASRSGEYAGVTEPEFGEDVTEEMPAEKFFDKYKKQDATRSGVTITYPKWCRVTVKRLMANGSIVEFTAKEFWKENYSTASRDSSHPNSMWTKRPYAQLAKCTEAQALRKAFPEFGSQPTADEMEGKEIYVSDADSTAIAASQIKETVYLNDESFKKMTLKFQSTVASGEKSPHDLIQWQDSKVPEAKLTEDQKNIIKSWQVIQDADFTDNPRTES